MSSLKVPWRSLPCLSTCFGKLSHFQSGAGGHELRVSSLFVISWCPCWRTAGGKSGEVVSSDKWVGHDGSPERPPLPTLFKSLPRFQLWYSSLLYFFPPQQWSLSNIPNHLQIWFIFIALSAPWADRFLYLPKDPSNGADNAIKEAVKK